MTETILISLLVAKIKGYKLKLLFKQWDIYPVLAFSVMYLAIEMTIFRGNYSLIKYASIFKILYLCSFLTIIIKYQQFIAAFIGSGFMILGSILNNIAISANNGKMPVFPTLSYVTGYFKPDAFIKVNDIHALGNGATKIKYLTDIIDLGYCIMSIGDVLIRIFAFIIIFNTIKHINISNREVV